MSMKHWFSERKTSGKSESWANSRLILPGVDRRLVAAIGVIGLNAIITQTILLREFLSVFFGNELVIGIVLANWMILTGTGAFLGKLAARGNRIHIAILLSILTSVLPLVTVFLLEYLRNLVFPVGAMIGIVESFYSSFLLLLPFCVVSGSLFTLFASIVSDQCQSNQIPGVYSVEAIGSVVGGLVFNLILVFIFSSFQILFLLALFNLGVCLLLSIRYAARMYQILAISCVILLLLTISKFDIDAISKSYLFPDQEVLAHKDTPYGAVTVTKQQNQINFFEQGSLLFATDDPSSNEDATHYAMVQHPHPQRVLLIGGGISGTTEEILKYGIERLDYVELNPSLIELGKHFTTALVDRRIHTYNQDGKRFVRTTTERYDVVLINIPDPSTAQTNRYYTTEFLQQLKARLNSGAVVSFALLESVDYLSPEARDISSVFYNTLKAHFKNVLIIPGLRNHYIASDSLLTTKVTQAIAQKGISTIAVNHYYVDDRLLQQRSNDILRVLDPRAKVNSDFSPVAYYRQLAYWLSYFGVRAWMPAAFALFLFMIIGLRLNAISFGMFTGGFAASSIEIILLLAFQVIFGYVYQATGLIIVVFMAGLALGSLYGQRKPGLATPTEFIRVQIGISLYSLILPIVLYCLKDSIVDDILIYGAFVLLIGLIAALVGFEFSLAARLLNEKSSVIASTIYGVDLIGSAIGALIVSAYLIPVFGIAGSSIVVSMVCLASATVAVLAKNKYVIQPKGGESYV